MNILLIGNGFDLAHDLPTSYTSFLGFCKIVKMIYTLDISVKTDAFKSTNLDTWHMNEYIKSKILGVYENRRVLSKNEKQEEEEIYTEFSTNIIIDELYLCIKDNVWIDYFLQCSTYIGENWIDFESEISKVVRAIDSCRIKMVRGGSVNDVTINEGSLLMKIVKAAGGSMQNTYKNLDTIQIFIKYLIDELEKLIRALEIYISEFIGGIQITDKNKDIEKLEIDHVLSFNYSDTYEKIYGKDKKIEYDYIHGRAAVNNTIMTNNMVVGIDEYLKGERKDEEIDFIAFKKFYQRIHKQIGCNYKRWIEIIEKDELKTTWLVSGREHSKDYRHNLYIFGHSLDVTDKDILRDMILHKNVNTTIFYYERVDENGNGDNGRKELGQKIANLVKVIGQDELIKRTGGSTKTIEFKLQQPMKKVE